MDPAVHLSFSSAIAWLTQLDPVAENVQLTQRLSRFPRCPVARYLAGCRCFDLNLPAHATRNFMIAQHVEPQFESAALLVFTGLAWISQREASLLDTLIRTWHEYRRMPFDRTPREQRLLNILAAGHDPEPPGESALARFGRLPIRAIRDELRRRAASNRGGGSDTISPLRSGLPV